MISIPQRIRVLFTALIVSCLVSSIIFLSRFPTTKTTKNNNFPKSNGYNDTKNKNSQSTTTCLLDWVLNNVTNNVTLFYPKQFMEYGLGKDYLPQYQYIRDYQDSNLLTTRFIQYQYHHYYFNHPSSKNYYYNTTTSSSSCSLEPYNGTFFYYYHIHKNGGTTMQRQIITTQTDNNEHNNMLTMQLFYSKQELAMGGKEPFEQYCLNQVMKPIYENNRNNNNKHSFMFTFIRDPISRFISGVAQVLKLKNWHTRLYPCYVNTTNATFLLQCVIQKIKHQNSFLDMHLMPQVYELYKGILEQYDIGIYIIPDISINLPQVVKNMGAKKNLHKDRPATGIYIRRFPGLIVTQNALTSTLIHELCELYQMDVLFLQQLGYTTKEAGPCLGIV